MVVYVEPLGILVVAKLVAYSKCVARGHKGR